MVHWNLATPWRNANEADVARWCQVLDRQRGPCRWHQTFPEHEGLKILNRLILTMFGSQRPVSPIFPTHVIPVLPLTASVSSLHPFICIFVSLYFCIFVPPEKCQRFLFRPLLPSYEWICLSSSSHKEPNYLRVFKNLTKKIINRIFCDSFVTFNF